VWRASSWVSVGYSVKHMASAAMPASVRWSITSLSSVALVLLSFEIEIRASKRMPAPVVEGTLKLGFDASVIVPLGVVMIVCWVLSVVPRTAVIGTLLFTGYLGGAVCSHVRVGDPLFSHTLFPVYFGIMLWGGLWLRDPRVRALLPFSSP
jgi:hypothetical protein